MDSLSGYVHSVSPVKTSKKKSKFFNFHVQTGDETYKRAVCFDPEMQTKLRSFQESQTPIKLKNLNRSTSRDGDIFVSKRSRVEKASLREVPFCFSEIPVEQAQAVTCDSLREIASGQLVTIDARIYKSSKPPKFVRINEEEVMCLENCVVVDETGTFRLTLWGGEVESVKEGTCLKITNLRLKSYQGRTSLSTTPITEFLPLSKELPMLQEEEVEELSSDEVCITVNQVHMAEGLRTWITCKRCGKAISELLSETIVKCANCGAAQRSQNCETHHAVRLNVCKVDEAIWITAFDDVMEKMLDKYNEENHTRVTVNSSDDEVYEALLSLPQMEIGYHSETKSINKVSFM